MNDFITKDSGERAQFESGMQRDTQAGKPRFDLLHPVGVPYQHQFLTRVAELMARGAEKYDERNWEQADGIEELRRFKASAERHLMQWLADETDEDHAAAVVFNLLAYETTLYKIRRRAHAEAQVERRDPVPITFISSGQFGPSEWMREQMQKILDRRP